MSENIFNISIALSIIPTIEYNKLKLDNNLMEKRITELMQEKEILQKIILSKYTQ